MDTLTAQQRRAVRLVDRAAGERADAGAEDRAERLVATAGDGVAGKAAGDAADGEAAIALVVAALVAAIAVALVAVAIAAVVCDSGDRCDSRRSGSPDRHSRDRSSHNLCGGGGQRRHVPVVARAMAAAVIIDLNMIVSP